ncbi:Acetyl esterase/lipase [Cohaesibacter sp. ES.047]|uniref:alpha/beta hydrolase fold domain-containing protein n=1 Tax=Cohaesibacter sp. ES.047 TaxID=1798205 RepID=UPI000BB832F9|nr:alpha/beta hydrolase fold domain-containing protein [Cohaesibacter sp. ES.047]SNY93706.1 Acetyl esterase/lipase [Cohaesibacter sp. ES.047]
MTKAPNADLLKVAARYSYNPDPSEEVTPQEARERLHEIRKDLLGVHDAVVSKTDHEIDGHVIHLFRRKDRSEASEKAIIYIHGGGWCKCDPQTHGSIMTDLAGESGLDVYGITYPMSPENVYPSAIDAVCDQIKAIGASLHKGELIVAGDSAGANLALAAALRLRDEDKIQSIVALLLWYGCYRYSFDTRSHKAYGDGSFGLATDGMREMWDDYLGGAEDAVYGELSGADFSNLPPCYLCEAEFDCLADDTRWLASRLMEDGGRFYYDFYPETNHGFLHYSAHFKPSMTTIERAIAFLTTAAVKD